MDTLRALLIMTTADVRQQIRNRSFLIFALIVPLAMMTMMHLMFSSVGDGSLPTGEDRPELTLWVSGPTDTGIGAQIIAILDSIDTIELTMAPSADDAEGLRAGIDRGDTDMGLVIPEGADAAIAQGGRPEMIMIVPAEDTWAHDVVASVVESVIAETQRVAGVIAVAQQHGASGPELAALAQTLPESGHRLELIAGEVAAEQLDAKTSGVAGQAAMFMFFSVGFGVLAYLAEAELGTLNRLRSLPVARWTIVAAKALSSLVLGVVSTSVLLALGEFVFGLSFGSPIAVLVLIVAAVIAATSLVFVVASLARSSEQANMANSIVAITMGTLGGAFFPIGGDGWLARLSDLTPPAAMLRGLGITHAGGGVGDLGDPLLTLAGFTVVGIILSAIAWQRGTPL